MTARIADSLLYGHLWGTAETRALFDERARLQGWLEVLVALARAQAAEGVIPDRAAAAIAEHADASRLDLDFAAERTRHTGHSMAGLIQAVQAILPEEAREQVYVGATVQDITDTWTSLVMRRVGGIAWRDLRDLEETLLALAKRHRSTAMPGRTHGQPATPVTFGWKAATWADEVRRHLDRLRGGSARWLVGQLGGGSGSLVSYAGRGPAVRARFCAELGLGDPGISWLTARDRVAEFAQVLTLICGTLARIGSEVYELARPELGELTEPAAGAAVSSITMPHKRNPERAEHLDTLARLARANTGVLVEGMVAQHERDGRAWKAEWVALPEVCLLTAAALQIAGELLAGLEVHPEAMAANLRAQDGYGESERILARLTPRMGKHQAQDRLQQAARQGRQAGLSLAQALARSRLLDEDEARELTALADTGSCAEMVDTVVARAHAARASEPGIWP